MWRAPFFRHDWLILALLLSGCATTQEHVHVVTLPVVDVRAEPGSLPTPGIHDPLQETQLLYGEQVHVLTTQGAWASIEALEQPEYTHAHR